MTCKQCIMWESCSAKDGTTRYYGKEVATNEAERLCSGFCPRDSSQPCPIKRPITESLQDVTNKKSIAYYMRKIAYVGLVLASILIIFYTGLKMVLSVYAADLTLTWSIVCYSISAVIFITLVLLIIPLQFLFYKVFWQGKKMKDARKEFLDS